MCIRTVQSDLTKSSVWAEYWRKIFCNWQLMPIFLLAYRVGTVSTESCRISFLRFARKHESAKLPFYYYLTESLMKPHLCVHLISHAYQIWESLNRAFYRSRYRNNFTMEWFLYRYFGDIIQFEVFHTSEKTGELKDQCYTTFILFSLKNSLANLSPNTVAPHHLHLFRQWIFLQRPLFCTRHQNHSCIFDSATISRVNVCVKIADRYLLLNDMPLA